MNKDLDLKEMRISWGKGKLINSSNIMQKVKGRESEKYII